MRVVFDLEHADAPLVHRHVVAEQRRRDRLEVVGAEHLPVFREVVHHHRRAVDADERLPAPHEVDDRLLLDGRHADVSVGHHHQAVELVEVGRGEEASDPACRHPARSPSASSRRTRRPCRTRPPAPRRRAGSDAHASPARRPRIGQEEHFLARAGAAPCWACTAIDTPAMKRRTNRAADVNGLIACRMVMAPRKTRPRTVCSKLGWTFSHVAQLMRGHRGRTTSNRWGPLHDPS